MNRRVTKASGDLDFATPSTVVLLSLIFGLSAFGTDMYLPAFPAIRVDFGANAGAVQLSLSFFLYGNGLGQLIFGPLSDRFGRKPVLLLGLTGFALASFACVLTSNITELLATRFVQGAASASGPVLVRALINDKVDREKAAQMIALLTGLMAITSMLTPIIGGWIVQHMRWQIIFVVIGCIGACLLLMSATSLQESLAKEHRLERLGIPEIFSGYLEIARNRAFWCYVLPSALMFAGVFAYVGINSFLLIDDLNMSEQFYGIYFSIAASAYVLGSLTARYLLRLVGVVRCILIGLTLGFVTALASVIASLSFPLSVALVMVPGLFIFFATALILPGALSVAVSLFPHRAGSASALVGFTQITFAGLSTALAGHLYNSSTLPLYLFILGCCIVAIMVWVGSAKIRRDASPA